MTTPSRRDDYGSVTVPASSRSHRRVWTSTACEPVVTDEGLAQPGAHGAFRAADNFGDLGL